ncbi:hypothetical protein TSOC_002551, partial [Tetrabaena socialis]
SSASSGETAATESFLDLRGLRLRRGQPELCDAVQSFPGFSQLLDVQGEVLRNLEGALGVRPAQTKHTDGEGVLTLQSLQPGSAVNLFRSYRNGPRPTATAPEQRQAAAVPAAAPDAAAPDAAGPSPSSAPLPPPPPLRTMTQIFARYRTPDGTMRVYSKTTASTPDRWPTPQLDIEIGGTEQSLIFYVAMAPRAPLTTDLPYLAHYYDQPPPPPPAVHEEPPAAARPRQDGEPSSSSANASSGGGSGGGGASGLPSFKQLEAEARKEQGFTPFVSPSLWVRAMAVGALCFSVAWQGGRDAGVMEAVRRYTTTLTDIWLAHLIADARNCAAGSAGPVASPDGCWPDPPAALLLAQRRQAAQVLRNHVRHDPLTPLLYPVYGEPQVTKWIKTVAGEEAQPAH